MKHLKVNDKAPAFESIDQHGNAFSSATLTGKKFVLYFYPKDLTPGCTAQACNLRDNYAELKTQGIEIIGVSMDDVKLHTRFIEKYELPFTLLAAITIPVPVPQIKIPLLFFSLATFFATLTAKSG